MNDDQSTAKPTCQKCKTEIVTPAPQVTCDKCNSTFHESCVKVNNNVQIWSCIICVKDGSSHLVPPAAPRSKRSKTSRHTSSTMSSKTKQKMLDALQEEMALLEKQAKEKEELLKQTHEKQMEIMKRKHDTLLEIASSKSSSSRSSLKQVPSLTGNEKVEEWIQTQNEDQDNADPTKKVAKPPSKEIHFEKDNVHTSTKVIESQVEPDAGNRQSTNFDKNRVQSTTFQACPALRVPETVHLPHTGSHLTFNVNRESTSADIQNRRPEIRGGLSREEIAARHIVKDLPKFDGKPRLWPRFITSYRRSTKVCGFNDFENLERLNHSLCGNAYLAVKSSLLFEENVPRILETLEQLYGKPEYIINSLLDDLRKAPTPTYESIDSILKYALEVENVAMTMVIAKLAEHVWNPILLNELVEKLPTQMKFEWATYKYNSSPCSIEVFSLWLKNKATVYASILTKPPNIGGTSKKESRHSVNVHQASKKSCLICYQSCSSILDCAEFKRLTLQQKWNSIRKFRICRTCLRQHPSKKCEIDTPCGVDGCQYRHNSMLHPVKSQTISEEEEVDGSSNVPTVNIHATVETYFKIMPVFLTCGDRKVMTYAMLDDGSSLTLLDNSVASALKLVGEKQPLCLRWTNGVERRENSSEVVSFSISPFSENRQFKLKNVRTVENLNLPNQTINMELLSSMHAHLKDVNIKSFENVQPKLLIGLDHSRLLTVQKYKFGKSGEPSAAKTPLGWCLFGSGQKENESVLHIQHCQCEENLDRRLEEMVRENFTMEAIGISTPSSLPQAKEDEIALEILTKTVKKCGRQFEVGLLWKYNRIQLPNSLPMAKRRLQCLERKMIAEPELRSIINNQIEEYLSKRYIRKIDSTAFTESDGWYLPIFVVRNANKPQKIRMVWDAAAEVNGVSLNHVLLKGPDLLSSLPGVLMRFREHAIAITGDIREMFHQVLIKESDRKFQRFLWRSHSSGEIEIYEMGVMTFGACCSPSCAQYIKNLNAETFRQQFPAAVDAIQTNHYVDDWLQSVDSTLQAVELADQVKQIHHEGGFEIHKWISNSKEVTRKLNGTHDSAEKNMELCPKFETDKVLGMFWSTTTDAFEFTLKLNGVNAKIILLQSIWRSRIDWDEEIQSDHSVKWKLWAQNLQHLAKTSIPRWIGLHTKETSLEIHTFVDASEDAFAAAVYFKVINGDDVKCSLIMSKSRVAPLKSLSIPRLELQAAVLGMRIANFVIENTSSVHTFSKRYFWTDSQTVVKWLNSDSKKYTQYVSCRVGEILESSRAIEWNWISGKLNPADMSTMMRIFDERQVKEWMQGPRFLYGDNYPIKQLKGTDCKEELRHIVTANIAFHEETEFRVGKWRKLRRVYAFVFRYVRNLRKCIHQQTALEGPLTSEEYKSAQAFLIRKCQREGFPEEYQLFSEGQRLRNRRSVIFKDSPFMDANGILRANSRIQYTGFAGYDTKNPILLPRSHRITEMILSFYHERYHHLFVATVANEVKQKFVVHRLKVKLKEIRRNCQLCKNRDARPIVPEEGQLPLARLTPFTRPFCFIGMDYFGPIQVAVGRKTSKRWCMLVTCLTTRAIHMEVVHSLSTDSCIKGLRRFISRRGKPNEIYTDNGTNFRGAKRELREIWDNIDKHQVAEAFIDCDTQWKFIPPVSPHMGGAWERMVRTVKTSLKAAFPYRTPNDETLLTMLAEVEHIINSRPLTYVEIESEHHEALAPNHLILGSSSVDKPLGKLCDGSGHFRENWQMTQHFANVFWKRWVAEYLPTLSRRTKWFEPTTTELLVGDIVILLGEEKRGIWPKGKIVEVHRSKDGHVRSADVQLETGIYTRPTSKIAVLDVRGQQNSGTLEINTRIPGGSVNSDQRTQSATPQTDDPARHPRSLRALPHRVSQSRCQKN